MTVMTDIAAGIEARRKVRGSPDERLVVLVGKSAERALCCFTPNKVPPASIMGCPLEFTGEFPGWDIVPASLMGKR
jgi:hypothetical protein